MKALRLFKKSENSISCVSNSAESQFPSFGGGRGWSLNSSPTATTWDKKNNNPVQRSGAYIIIVALFSIALQSYSQEWQWAKQFAGIGADPSNYILRSNLDDDGNVYIFGRFGNQAKIDGVDIHNPSTGGNWQRGTFIAKLNPQGQIVWKKVVRSNTGTAIESYPKWIEFKENEINLCLNFDCDLYFFGNEIHFFDAIMTFDEMQQIPIQDQAPPFKNGRWSAFVTLDYNGNVLDQRFIQLEARSFFYGERLLTSLDILGNSPFHVDNNGNTYIFANIYVQDWDYSNANLPLTLNLYDNDGYHSEQDFWIQKEAELIETTGTLIEATIIKITANWEVEWVKPMFDTVIASPNGTFGSYNYCLFNGLTFDENDNMYLTIETIVAAWCYTDNPFPLYFYLDEEHNHRITYLDESAALSGGGSGLGSIIKYNNEGNVEWCNQLYSKKIGPSPSTMPFLNGTIITNNDVFVLGSGGNSDASILFFLDENNEEVELERSNPGQLSRTFIAKFDKTIGKYVNHGIIPAEIRSTLQCHPIPCEPAMINNHIIANSNFFTDQKDMIIASFNTENCQLVEALDTIYCTNYSKKTGSVNVNNQGDLFIHFTTAANTINIGNLPTVNTIGTNTAVFALKNDPSLLIPYGTQTYTISGTVTSEGNGLAGVTISYLTTFTTTNTSGYYEFEVAENTNITLTPNLAGYAFTPSNIPLGNVTQNYANQNFTANQIFVETWHVASNITIYPNPATNVLHFSEAIAFEITDLQGRLLLQSKKAVKNVNISNLEAGIYLIKICAVKHPSQTQKFVKE